MKIININQLLKELDKYTFKQFHIHHTWKPTHKSFKGDNHMAMQQSMKDYHMRSNGWSDIGQHASLFPDGVFVTGRPFNISPASIKDWNTGSFALEIIGNFDEKGKGTFNSLGYDKLEGIQKENLLKLIKYFVENYGQASIKFHREGPGVTKTCPGTSLNKLDLIRQAIIPTEEKDPLKEGYKVENIKLDIHDKKMEVKGIVQDGINYIPIRVIEDLGYKVTWVQNTKTVKVEYK